MQSSHDDPQNSFGEFSPFLTNPLPVEASSGFSYLSAYYNQKNNFILANPVFSSLQLYDATTFLPLQDRDLQQATGLITETSYNEEIDTHLFGYDYGFIYAYNASQNQLKKVQKSRVQTAALELVSSKFYAFSLKRAEKLYLGDLEEEDDVMEIDSQNSYFICLHRLVKNPLLFAGLADGSIRIFSTINLPKLPSVDSVQAEIGSFFCIRIQSAIIDGKEYVITAMRDTNMKIWCLRKGKLRLIRVIRIMIGLRDFVYLENYKLIAMIFEGAAEIEFWSILTGKLERRLSLGEHYAIHMFLMKDKNMIGIPGLERNVIEFIQLHNGRGN